MKTFAFLMVFGCVITSLTAAQDTAPPFKVECGSATTANLTLNPGKEIRGIDPCKPTLSGPKTFIIDSCLSGKGAFLVLTSSAVPFVVKNKTKEYRVSCTENENGTIVPATLQLKSAFGSSVLPSVETSNIKHAKPALSLLLMKTKPSEKPKASTVASVALGQSIFLTLVSDITDSGTLDLIPLLCEAYADSVPHATLWKLHNKTNSNKCSMETSVVKKSFSMEGQYTVAEIEAFTFADAYDKDITIECSVRVCRTDTTGLCQTDKTALRQCDGIPGTNAPGTNAPGTNAPGTNAPGTNAPGTNAPGTNAPGTNAPAPKAPATKATNVGRRRRALKDNPGHNGDVHHVTATLRIRNDVMTEAGSTNIYYHMYSLILPLLVKIFL